jgi:hypothetical protein
MALQLFEIADTTVSSPVSVVTFLSIPQGYTDLILYASPRGTVAEDGFSVRINNDSATNYSFRQFNGNGSAVASTAGTTQNAIAGGRQPESGYTANAFGSNQFYFSDYTSNKFKSVLVEAVSENNATTVRTQLTAGLYPVTTAISRLDVFPGSGLFATNSTFTLYGVL